MTDTSHKERRILPAAHFIGVCGKGMGAVAQAFLQQGWRVTGSDDATYPPMSSFLEKAGLYVRAPYRPSNIPDDTEIVVVGKRVRPSNPELDYIIKSGRPYTSFPKLLHEFFLSRSKNAVVSGGVGKTTTTAMLAWIIEHAGHRPDYLIGGFARNFATPSRLEGAETSVIEGDEYSSCFDDPTPKFLYYNPFVAIITNILEEHPDLYPGLGALEKAFSSFADAVPDTGWLVIPDDDEAATKIAAQSGRQCVSVGFSPRADHRIKNVELSPGGSRFELETTLVEIPQCGSMNVRNAAMAITAALLLGVPSSASARALADFKGVENRQDAHAVGKYTIISDRATNPVAIRGLFESVRQRYPNRRIFSVIQPRGVGGRSWIYQSDLPAALSTSDHVFVLSSYEHNPEPGRSWQGGDFSIDELSADLAKTGVEVTRVPDRQLLGAALMGFLNPQDLIVLSLPEQITDILPMLRRDLR